MSPTFTIVQKHWDYCKALRIFVADGAPHGLRPVERSNWVGNGRIEWKDAQGRTLKELLALEAGA